MSDDTEEDSDASIYLSSDAGLNYTPPPWQVSKIKKVQPKRGRPPTTQDYVGLVRTKQVAARAEERLQRARLDNLRG